MSSPIRLMLVDDQALFREGLRTLLELNEDLIVCSEASNGEEALKQIQANAPDLVLMDINMPLMNGIQATVALKKVSPNIKILILTTFDDDERVFEALRAGASGYLLKDTPSEQLAAAIKTVHRGESFLQPSIASKVLAEFNRLRGGSLPPEQQLIEPLSRRETEIVQLLAQGMSNKEIAARAFLAEGTVKNHISNILGKMGVQDRTQAALRARELGLV